MADRHSRHVVVGGGIAGLLCALLLSERKGLDVTLVEREPSVGGLLGRLDYDGAGTFDLGMHNMYETGIANLDGLLYGLLPADDWQILEGNRRDLAGSWFHGRLQVNSPYPDLRHGPADRTAVYRREVLAAAAAPTSAAADGALDESVRLFGRSVTDDVIAPILSAQFRTDPRLLHRSALWLTNIHRVLLLDGDELLARADEPGVRERIAFPEQRSLPPAWASGRRAFYPRKYGMHRVVDAIVARLDAAGVRIVTSAQPVALETASHGVGAVAVDHGHGATERIGVDRVFWTASPPALARLLGVDTGGFAFDHARPTWIVNVLLRDRPRMDDLYYFFNYSPEFDAFRVTNYSAYCDGAPRNGRFPVAVELLLADGGPPEAVAAQAIDELVRFGVVDGPDAATFAAATRLAAGIPLLTAANMSSMADLHAAIESANHPNLDVLGLMSHRGIFFQRDVLADVWRRVMEQPAP